MRRFTDCCAKAYSTTIATWRRRKDTYRRLVPVIAHHAVSTWGFDLLAEAALDFPGGRSPDGMRGMRSAFDRWFVFDLRE